MRRAPALQNPLLVSLPASAQEATTSTTNCYVVSSFIRLLYKG